MWLFSKIEQALQMALEAHTHFVEMKTKFEGVEKQLDKQEVLVRDFIKETGRKYDDLNRRVDQVEASVKASREGVEHRETLLTQQTNELLRRLDKVEAQIDEAFRASIREVIREQLSDPESIGRLVSTVSSRGNGHFRQSNHDGNGDTPRLPK